MEIVIDVTSPVFPYVQVANQLREKIESGEITGAFPSLKTIARDAGISYNTAQRAVGILKEEGLVFTAPGRGTFVRRQG